MSMHPPKKFRFVTIGNRGGEDFEGHPVYRIFNNKSGAQLGIISWYKPWKCYVFSSREECVFNLSCLFDVQTYMAELTRTPPPKPEEGQ